MQVLFFWPLNILAATNEVELVKVGLISELQSVPDNGKDLWIGLHQIIQPGWHTYWRYAGDSGLPTRLSWKTNKNADIGNINWPLPQIIKVGPLVSYGYENETVLLVPINIRKLEAIDLTVAAEWLVCKEICIPQRKVLRLHLPRGAGKINPANSLLIKRFRRQVPIEMGWHSKAFSKGKLIRLKIFMSNDDIEKIDGLRVYPGIDGLIDNNALQKFNKNKSNIVIDMKAGYAIEEGLNFFEGVIRIAKIKNGKIGYRAYRIKKLPILFE